MKQHSKKAIQEAERLGYEYARTNSSNFLVYEHPTAGEVCLSPSMSENACRNAIRQMQKAVGALVRTGATTGKFHGVLPRSSVGSRRTMWPSSTGSAARRWRRSTATSCGRSRRGSPSSGRSPGS